jgi:hypothetical protein
MGVEKFISKYIQKKLFIKDEKLFLFGKNRQKYSKISQKICAVYPKKKKTSPKIVYCKSI